MGNRLTRASTLQGVTPQSSTYDKNDRLTNDGYDPNGNTRQSADASYTYDWENRLTEAGSGAVSYAYDGDGNRVSKTVGGVTTRYLVDTNNPTGYAQVVEELQGGAVVRQYAYGHDLISQRQLVSGQWSVSYYGYDGHGSVRLLTDSSGSVTDTYTYDAFGSLISRTGATPNEYLYAGERYDAETGMYHLRARYMRPDTGRFWSMDSYEGSLSDPASLHKYTYAHNNPANYLDPSGHQVTTMEMWAAVGIMVVLASYLLYTFAPLLDRIYASTTSYTSSAPLEAETETGVETSTETTTETTQEEDKDDDSEVFYRAMGEKEWKKVQASSGQLAIRASGGSGRELFVTQNLNYVATLSMSDDRFPIIVKFNLQKGTLAMLMANAAIDSSVVENEPYLKWMPIIDSGNPNKVHMKYERGALTYGLRRNTISIFNSGIKSFRKIGQKGQLF